MTIKGQKTFKGGIRFFNFDGNPSDKIVSLSPPPKVIIPLRQGFSGEVKPLVRVGEEVRQGQVIGRDDENISTPVHASINGVVEEIKRMNYFKRDVLMAVIRANDSSMDMAKIEGAGGDWKRYSKEELERLLYLSGVTALDHEGIPTRYKSSIISPEEVEELIVHGVGSEPYNISSNLIWGGKNLFYILEGIRILKKVMPAAKVYLAINKFHRKVIEELNKLTVGEERLSVVTLEPKYPQGYDEVLIPTILKKKFPYGYSAANIGIVVLSVATILAVYKAAAEGIPLIKRTIALAGASFKENVHMEVAVGTTVEWILKARLKDEPSRIILNSVLTGPKLTDFSLPLDKTCRQLVAIPERKEREFLSFTRPGLRRHSYSHAFLSSVLKARRTLDTNLHGEERPCISCGFCEEICPVRIIPHLIMRLVERNMVDETMRKYAIFNCIECNLCTFVCPSKIPLARKITEAQEKLIMEGCDRAQCILPHFGMKGLEQYRGVRELK